ncbi:uncharacterized protein LOC131601793 [Vicia villosa]|uniref:uncharacterized protein LOC131601793 n=1 Tax=Vicia villosa TaxID=3911 RepID=UPI00273A7EB1|nr:uncharacterized protein LOC131601793 [Vicia villosa]
MKRKRSSLKIPQQIVSTDLYLDDDCWEYIFKFIFNEDEDDNRYYFKSLSIVNKQFLSITNRLRHSLTVWNPTCCLLSRLFPRFINLISLDLSCYYGNINNLLVQISRYPLKLTSLNLSNQPNIPSRGLRAFSRNITTLTSLICSNIASLTVADLLLISHCFPILQELDLSNSINFTLNADVPMVFPKLRKVNLYGRIITYITDEWLLHFFKNSEFLQHVVMMNSSLLTHQGIASAIRERPTLKSLAISCVSINDNITSSFTDSFMTLKDLTCLDLSYLRISDELLFAMIGLPLKKLVLHACKGYSYAGIFCLLSKYQHIQHLDLRYSEFLNDQHVMRLSLFFGHLVSINLSYCSMLAEPALFSLVRNSPLLTEVKMENTSIGREHVINSNSFEDFVVSHSLKSLHLAYNYWLRDESIKMFASAFPNLEVLVLRRCCKIRDLSLYGCSGVKLHGMNFEVPKLKVLDLSCTSVDDEALYVISKSCSGLLQLVLRSCNYVTKEGIKHVVKNCTQLREINLMCCYKLLPNIVDEMIFSRPSLRKITASPSKTFSFKKFSDEKKKLFSRYGCRLMC